MLGKSSISHSNSISTELDIGSERRIPNLPTTFIGPNPFKEHIKKESTLNVSLVKITIDFHLKIQSKIQSMTAEETEELKKCKKLRQLKYYPEMHRYNVPLLKKLLLLDMDETLVYAYNIHTNRNNSQGIAFSPNYRVILRPFLSKFLQQLEPYYHIILFSSANELYVRKIVKIVDESQQYIKQVCTNHDCTKTMSGHYVKDISIFNRDPKDVVIIDNSLVSFANNIENGIWIKPFYGEENDMELETVAEFLLESQDANDMRDALRSKYHIVDIVESFTDGSTN